MKPSRALMFAALIASGCNPAPKADSECIDSACAKLNEEVQPIILTAPDGVKVYGSLYEAANPKAVILLFHQAGSSKDEYATIAPRLVAAGYTALAIDQRSGGDLFGPNQTVAALGKSRGYAEAALDLDAAINWAKAKGAPIVLWGSSYSSALVFPVAAKHGNEIGAILAFSPGEYIDGQSIMGAAAKIRRPVFVTSAKNDEEVAAAKAIFNACPSTAKTQFVPTKGGVHGSSTLIAARNPKGAEENWSAVLAFLGRVSA